MEGMSDGYFAMSEIAMYRACLRLFRRLLFSLRPAPLRLSAVPYRCNGLVASPLSLPHLPSISANSSRPMVTRRLPAP